MQDTLIGQELPRVALESSAGGEVHLPESLKGQWTILYFYPQDDTPGCTRQACSYRDHLNEFASSNIRLIGVSLDDLTSHEAFIRKYGLNFELLADTKRELSEALGVYGPQEWKGQVTQGLSRDTFLIGPDGRIRQVWRKVHPDKTMEETLSAARRYMSS